MSISAARLQQLETMIQTGTSDDFYDWTEWVHKRQDVLRMDKRECQRCKACGRYRRAVIVHHVKHLRDRPDLALSVIDPDTGMRQLVSLCRTCHEELHPERGLKRYPGKLPLTTERWD